jgi:two-component system, cell cycle sensor histidine kinase and response regulator CckA
MKVPIHILHLEDDEHDAALIKEALSAGPITCAITRVQDRAEFVAALENGGIDLVISDRALPTFDGMEALALVRHKWPEVPYILVSGSVGEEIAVESLKSGAIDYILKDRLSRLVPAIQRAVKETEEREERKHLQEQIIQSQKMELFGQLAASVAHDFNNILAIIMGYSDMLIDTCTPDNQREYAETIRQAADRALGLTRQLLIFSRKQSEQPVVLDLNRVIADMQKMLRRLMYENIELIFVPGNNIGRAKADAGYVWQVLMNLVVNARDAMPNGGKLTIATGSVALDENDARMHPGVTPGNYVMLSVSDTGTGITDAVKANLFEAFFTTKPKGKGTGLGLATCQTIAKQCGGHIGFYSEVGKGTTFKVYFPQVDLPLDEATQYQSRGALPRGEETLLLVEDDPELREMARTILTTQGYEVLCAAHGQDGLDTVRNRTGSPIRLVITDVVMPHVGGKAMTESLKTTNPHLKILFTSGYSEDAITHHEILEPGVAFLSKPYTPSMLARKVRELLDDETLTTRQGNDQPAR